jgi:hypothetical protein
MINPYLDQTIADQFQAEADLSEFDRLDIAVLGNVASKKKNDIGINKLKQDAAFGLTPMQSVFKLYNEKRQAEEELAQREAETQQFDNIYASMDDAMGETMGYGGPTADRVALNPWLSKYKPKLDMPGLNSPSPVAVPGMETMEPVMPGSTPPAPAGPYTPGSYTAGLNTQLGSEMEGLYGMKREYAPDAAYNQAMAAVREALGKAPNVPTMAKPQLTQEDQALIALAGIFGGFQNMPQALQGALAGAQQRAEIQNQQLQNKFQQEQAVYGRQLQALQGIAQTEEERRKQAQETLDRQYEQAYRTRLGGIEKLKANISNAPLKEQELAQKKESADTTAQLKAWQQNKSMLDQDLETYRGILELKMKKEQITKQDYEGLLGRKNGLIQKYQKLGMGDIGSLFYVPPIGVNPQTIGEKMKSMKMAYDYGMRTGKSIAKEIGGSIFGDTDGSPFATEASEKLDKLTTAYNTEAKKVQPFILKYNKAIEALQQANIAYKNSQVVKGTSIVGEDTKLTAKLKTQFEEAYNKVQSMQKQYRQLMGPKSSFTRAKMAMESEYKKLGLPLNQSPVSKTPGNKTSQNTVETHLGTLTFNA